MQKPLAGLTGKNALRESVAGVTLLAIAIPLTIADARERLVTFGLLEGEPVYPTNRAAIEALAPPIGWRERLRERLFPHAGRADKPKSPDGALEPNGPPTEPIQITRSSN
jgi:hypothetical protein